MRIDICWLVFCLFTYCALWYRETWLYYDLYGWELRLVMHSIWNET